ncbi:hypothetical protein GJ654_08800 [Rhodoblastus acidophilus]|uniref:Uncharacterized protein n=1 Tax=Rhodoblastus acidophilus TaxID=1074 RepID=A0A6N8DPI4_RHOAC|nr:hypothetical protein [Rhodoblastus acidophilus]MCW2274458.1 hypothetical protein [Rhodoblastus acidophilus]MTV31091.1 hypothetical protein [Rhodoblastus acidophilus]
MTVAVIIGIFHKLIALTTLSEETVLSEYVANVREQAKIKPKITDAYATPALTSENSSFTIGVAVITET